jgi:hypothetical protein
MTMPSPTRASPIAIDYAPRASMRWKAIRRGVVWLVVLVTLGAGMKWGPRVWYQARLLYWQRQCINFALPADFVVYEEEPAAAAALMGSDQGYVSLALMRRIGSYSYNEAHRSVAAVYLAGSDRHLQDLLPAKPWGSRIATPMATIFMHAVQTPAGQRRLVIVRYSPEQGTFTPRFVSDRNTFWVSIVPAPLVGTPTSTMESVAGDFSSAWPRQPPNVRIFAGQPDPADPSHFTIRYQMWGQEDIIDGTIDDQEQVSFRPRNPPTGPK